MESSPRAHQSFLLRFSDALRTQSRPEAIETLAVRLLAEELHSDRCYVVRASRAENIGRLSPEFRKPGLPPLEGTYAYSDFPDSGRRAETESLFLPDVANEPNLSERDKSSIGAMGLGALMAAHLRREKSWFYAMVVGNTTPRAWTSEDLHLVEDVAERTWAAAEHARAEAAVHETQRRLEDALATGRMAYWEWDRATDTVVASASMGDLFGLLPGEHIESTGQRVAIVHAEDRQRYSALVEKAGARREGWNSEFRIVRPRDGAVLWLEERATVTRDPVTGATHTTGMIWDVTDRKRAEAAAEIERVAHDRDALRRQLVQGEEEERRRLARELHDEAGQHLTALGLGLQALANVATPGSEIDRRATELRALANTLALEMHAIAVRLRPRALDDFGLEAALTAYTEEWTRHSGIEVDLHAVVGASRLPTAVETAIYRVVQEALTNVARHSKAQHAGVVVERRNGHVIAVVEDDGHGFPAADGSAEQPKESGSLGLLGIRERVALLGGTLDVESSPGSGTALFARIPLADAGGGAGLATAP